MKVKSTITHSAIVRHIAQLYNLDPVRVNHTIRVFMGFRGMGRHMKTGNAFYILGFGTFRPNRKRIQMLKRKTLIKKFKNRLRNKKTISRF